MKLIKNKKIIILILSLLTVLIISYVLFKNQKNNSNEILKITKHISSVLELPQESPTLAVITDTTQLSNQIFFKNSQNGDRVLMYEKSGIAILYRPKTKKIIHISTMTINELPTFTNKND